MESIKLVKPGFDLGTEGKFKKFMRNIGSGKIALISHYNDLDGVVSAKVINEVVHAHFLKFVDYQDVNSSLFEELRQNGITKIILSDLMIPNKEVIKEMEKFAEILIIDHHPPNYNFNSERTVFMNAQGYCAAYLSYYLFSKIKDIEFLDWQVVCASISDFQWMKVKRWMAKVYEKYKQNLIITGKWIDKTSDFYNLMDKLSLGITYFKPKTERVYSSLGREYGNIGDLAKYAAAVKNEIDIMVNRFEKEKKPIKDGWFFEFECIFQVRSYIVTEISLNYKDKTLIIGEKHGQEYRFSARRQDGKKDMNKMVKKLVLGFKDSSAGGHSAAAAGNFPVEYLEEFKKRLQTV